MAIELTKEQFDEELDMSHGVVTLGGEDFAYSHVYKTMYPDAYEEDYCAWKLSLSMPYFDPEEKF